MTMDTAIALAASINLPIIALAVALHVRMHRGVAECSALESLEEMV